MRTYINLNIRQQFRMSEQGYQRLQSKLKNVYDPFVFKTVLNVRVAVNIINTELKLAKFLFYRLGAGNFLIFKNRDEYSRGKEGFKYLCRVKITQISGARFDYDYTTTKGIARYGFWEKEWE